jgi:Sporulation and spore germination
MIPRYQRYIFWGLIGAIVAMALVLLRGCEQAREKLTRHRDETPLAAPTVTPNETVTLLLAKDSDGSLTPIEHQMSLPIETTSRARALLTRLIAEYSAKNSEHPLQSGPAVDDVFLLDLPLKPPVSPTPATHESKATSAKLPADDTNPRGKPLPPQLAVINLHGDFADHHPSGVEVESLTIQSILGTLHANFPTVQQVRFLVDGQPRDTLNGHADLIRIYTLSNPASKTVVEEIR